MGIEVGTEVGVLDLYVGSDISAGAGDGVRVGAGEGAGCGLESEAGGDGWSVETARVCTTTNLRAPADA